VPRAAVAISSITQPSDHTSAGAALLLLLWLWLLLLLLLMPLTSRRGITDSGAA
jgi:hypothetical protein